MPVKFTKKCYIHVIYHSSVHLAKTYFHGSSGVLIQCSYFITASKNFELYLQMTQLVKLLVNECFGKELLLC